MAQTASSARLGVLRLLLVEDSDADALLIEC